MTNGKVVTCDLGDPSVKECTLNFKLKDVVTIDFVEYVIDTTTTFSVVFYSECLRLGTQLTTTTDAYWSQN